jgi:hypothetical protein
MDKLDILPLGHNLILLYGQWQSRKEKFAL